MVKVKMSINGGFNRVNRRLKSTIHSAEQATYFVAEKLTNLIYDLAKEYAAINHGDMVSGIVKNAKITENGFEAIVEAGNGLIYVEYGTGLKAMEPSANGLPKNPVDIAHVPKGQWYIPLDILSGQQISDLRDKYHMMIWKTEEGKEFFICHGQAPQPFMYPAALHGAEALKDQAKSWFAFAFAKTFN